MVYKKNKKESPECQTDTTPLYGGAIGPFKRYIEKEVRKHRKGYPQEVVENLIHQYGTEHGRIMALAEEDESLKDMISDKLPDILAEVAYAVSEEMALHLDDVLFRRTGIGTLGNPGDDAIKKCADLMGGMLGWNDKDKEREIWWAMTYYDPIAKDGDIPPERMW